MPNFDQTGPLGHGAMVGGRGFGPCGCGLKRGYGRRYMTKGEEREVLEKEISELEKELLAMKERVREIKGDQ